MSAPAASLRTPTIALVGNPNIGKSTLFNRLTGIRQRVGNYPGVTVEHKSGALQVPSGEIRLVDLPGTYSLAASSRDERVVVDVLSGHLEGEEKPDAVLCVVDASNLSRNLFLASQVAETGLPMVIAMNLCDAAAQRGIEIDREELSRRLGVPVISTVAVQSEGIDALKVALEEVLATKPRMRTPDWPEAVERGVESLREACLAQTGCALTRAECLRVLFDAESAIPARNGWDAKSAVERAREELRQANVHPFAVETMLRYRQIDELLRGVVRKPDRAVQTRSEGIDAVLTHRVWGLVLFLGMMALVFQAVYSWARPLMDLIEAGRDALKAAVEPLSASMPVVASLLRDGVIEGVGSVLVFVPQIAVLFAFIALLEDTGYMARAAFLMDRLLSWCGLNGKSFVPLLSSYACAVPGIMATRTIDDPRARLATILIAPLMSCSARLPVYTLLIGAFVEPRYGPWVAGATLFGMHFLGLAIAIPVAWGLNRFVFRLQPQPFLLEMPPYRLPRFQDVLWRIWERVREFLLRAGTVICAIAVILWALLYFPRPAEVAERAKQEFAERGVGHGMSAEESAKALERHIDSAYVGQSYLGRFGKAVQPVFDAAGFDWKITVAVLSSFPAREVVIATLGVIYDLGGEVDQNSGDLRATLAGARWETGHRAGQPVFTLPTALAMMVFFALCLQCGATVATMAKESNWKWAVFGFVYMTVLAWGGAVATYQLGGLLLPK